MAKKRGGLGRGIGALIPSTTPAAAVPAASAAAQEDASARSSAPSASTEKKEAAPATSAAKTAPAKTIAQGTAKKKPASAKAASAKTSAKPVAQKKSSSTTSASKTTTTKSTARTPVSPTAPTEATAASTSASGRPVDMFFSADNRAAASPSRPHSALADDWARDAQSKRRTGAKKPRKATAVENIVGDEAAQPATPAEVATASRSDLADAVAVKDQKEAEVASASSAESAENTAPLEHSDNLVAVPGAQFAEVPINEIRENPRNPRTVFDEDELNELAYSLQEVGVLQPIVIRPITGGENGESFELVMGERRWRAAKRAGLASIPAIIRDTTDDDLLRDALLENLHRSQLNPLEEAAAYGQLLEDFGCTQDELSEKIGRSRPQISNTLRLLRLPPLVQRRLASGAISAGHARALLGLDDAQLQEELAQRIVNEGLSVRAVERLIANGVSATTGMRVSTPRRTSYNPRVVDMTSKLSNRLETPVRIDVGKRKGKITLEFTNMDDLDRLMERLGLDAEE